MAGKSDFLEALYLDLIYKSGTDATLASNAGSLTNLYVALHTGDPGDAGTQATNEVTTGQCNAYTRVTKNRSTDWTRTGNSISPAAAITFPTTNATGTGCTATHFSVGVAVSGATSILHHGTISPPIVIPATTAGVIPQLTTATAITED